MVPGSRIGIIARLTGLLIAVSLIFGACSSASSATTSSSAVSSTSTTIVPVTTTTISTTTTAAPAATTTQGATATTTEPRVEADAEVLIPDGGGPFPTAVLVHGGGWVIGSPAIMGNLARFLSDHGYLTVNTPYALSGETPGFPQAVDDVACAVRVAAAQPQSDGTVVVIGHSAGAHLAALVALDDGAYGRDCDLPPYIPTRLIGLAGPYDITRLGPLMIPFLGGTPEEVPQAWLDGNPFNQVDKNPDLDTLLLTGDEDALVDVSFAEDFAKALQRSGKSAQVEVVKGARHNDMHDPAFVGDLILEWLGR